MLLDVRGIVLRLTHEQFEQLCQNNPDRSLELTKDGELEIMATTGGESSRAESELIGELYAWNRQTKLGKTFSSSGAFILPNGAERSLTIRGSFFSIGACLYFPNILLDILRRTLLIA
jgi:Uma2 family endonuclease